MAFDISLFSAEALLGDAPIIKQLEKLTRDINYKTEEGETISVGDFYSKLNRDIAHIPILELDSKIVPGTEYAYILQVTNSLQTFLDKIESVNVKAIFFQSRLKGIRQALNNAGATFSAWYQIALSHTLKQADIKINVTTIKSLADSEFSRLVGGVDIDIEAMIESMEVQLALLKSNKSLALEKYKMAKDQVNAALSNIGHDISGMENLQQPKISLGDKYGRFVQQPTLKPPVEEEEDDEPVVFSGIKQSVVPVEVHTSGSIISDPLLGNVKLEEVDGQVSIITSKPTREIKMEKPEPTPVVSKKIEIPTEDDDDTIVVFKKIKKEEPIVRKLEPAIEPDDDDEDFPAIQQAQKKFDLKKNSDPAPGIKPKVWSDEDLDEIM